MRCGWRLLLVLVLVLLLLRTPGMERASAMKMPALQ
jgi:hypothetical protein